MARRDLTGAIDFGYLEGFAQGDQAFIDEVLELFREQAEIWRQMIDPESEGWRDAVHALKGSARGDRRLSARGRSASWLRRRGLWPFRRCTARSTRPCSTSPPTNTSRR